MKDIAYYNGEFAPIDEMKIPLNDRGNYFGDGVYEAVYARHHKPFALDDHFARLKLSLEMAEIEAPLPFEALGALVCEVAGRVDAREQVVYIQVTRGTYPRMHRFPPAGIKPNLLMFSHSNFMRRDLTKEVRLRTQQDERWQNCNIKSLNLLANVFAAQRAFEAGCEETVFYREGIVSECSSSNIFIIQNGVLRTAPLGRKLLAGVTRKHFLQLAREMGMAVREEAFTVEEMLAADEVFTCSTSTHGARVCEIDGKPVGGRDEAAMMALRKAYEEKVDQEVGAL